MPAATSVPQAFPEVLLDCSNGNYAGESKLPRVFQYYCHLTEHGSLDKALFRITDDDGARTAAVKQAQTKRFARLVATLVFIAGADGGLIKSLQETLLVESPESDDPFRTAEWLVLAKLAIDSFAEFDTSDAYSALTNINDVWDSLGSWPSPLCYTVHHVPKPAKLLALAPPPTCPWVHTKDISSLCYVNKELEEVSSFETTDIYGDTLRTERVLKLLYLQ